MEDNKKRNILIILLGIILLMLMFIIYLLISNNYRNNMDGEYNRLEIGHTNSKIEENNNIGGDTNAEDTIDGDNKNINVVENNTGDDASIEVYNDSNTNIINEKNNMNNNSKEETNIIIYSEDDVVGYFEGNESEIKNSSFKEKFKDYFIEIVDFIFYGTEIKSHTFNELTNTGKLKIISAALKIDSYIEEKSPGYKDTIKSTSNRVYNNAKEKLTTLFLDISSNVCKNKEDDCKNAKELFSDIKSTCKIGWSFIKSLLKSGSNKLKEWYEVYSEK